MIDDKKIWQGLARRFGANDNHKNQNGEVRQLQQPIAPSARKSPILLNGQALCSAAHNARILEALPPPKQRSNLIGRERRS